MSGGHRKKKGRRQFKRLELRLPDLHAIVARTESGALSAEDRETLKAAVETLAFLTQELERKGTSIDRLRRLLFGPTTEKTSKVLDEQSPPRGDAQAPAKEPRKGHGRNGAEDYRGAERVKVAHATLHHGDPCPECPKGKVYLMPEPGVLVRVRGMSPLRATVYEVERLRCNLCGKVFTAKAPEGVGDEKYDETTAAMIGLLKYGCGLPFNRLERLERGFGIPLPAATQWEVVRDAADRIKPAHEELKRQAAQGQVLQNDDTTMPILSLMKEQAEEAVQGEDSKERTGMFTSGIVSTVDGHRIALFFTGRKHAGENLADVLAKRSEDLAKPIQMCDALPSNTAGELRTIIANCLAHARRGFVDVAPRFPDECRYVLDVLRAVYFNDEIARRERMSPAQRLEFHKSESKKLMDDLEEWMRKQFDECLVEPNSGLGEAITYMQKHWPELTLFLKEPGAPLDNNVCERALKKAILHRKNSYFYKTENGARVGDIFMSLIHTAELNGVEPYDYLVELQRHAGDVARSPADWMPWNYRVTLGTVAQTSPCATPPKSGSPTKDSPF